MAVLRPLRVAPLTYSPPRVQVGSGLVGDAMLETVFGAMLTLAAARGGPQVADFVDERPFQSFEGRDIVVVDFWCRYEADGRRECDASARDGFVLPSGAGDWLERRTGPRPDLADTGLRKRVALEFRPGEPQPTASQDSGRRWDFWWPELPDPVWIVGLDDLEPHLFYLPVRPDERGLMTGDIPLRCGVRPDGYLGLCIFDRPLAGDAETAMANRAKALAANLRVEPAAADGAPSAGRFVRLNIAFDGAAALADDPPFENPVTLSQPDPALMTRLYPQRALEAGIEGMVVVECVTPAVTGPLENCTVIGEEPGGRGFGPPSVRIAETLTASPFRIDGRAYRQLVRQRILWRLH